MMVHVSRRARSQIDEIFWTIAADKPRAAREWILKLDQILARIESFPDSGRIVPEFDIPELREVFHGRYRVLYYRQTQAIVVSSVVHGARLLRLERDVHSAVNESE